MDECMLTSSVEYSDLVLEVYGSVEIWYFGVDGLADHFALGCM